MALYSCGPKHLGLVLVGEGTDVCEVVLEIRLVGGHAVSTRLAQRAPRLEYLYSHGIYSYGMYSYGSI